MIAITTNSSISVNARAVAPAEGEETAHNATSRSKGNPAGKSTTIRGEAVHLRDHTPSRVESVKHPAAALVCRALVPSGRRPSGRSPGRR